MLYMLYHFFTPYPVCEIVGKHLKIAEWTKQLGYWQYQSFKKPQHFVISHLQNFLMTNLYIYNDTYLNTYHI